MSTINTTNVRAPFTSPTPTSPVALAIEAALADLSAGPSSYVGQVATNSAFETNVYNAGLQWNSRTGHYARDDITSLQLAWANFYGNSETATGSSMTVEASIEYPVGTMTRVTFSGTNTQTIASGQMGALSDALKISIPRGAWFYVRSFQQCAGGVPYFSPPTTTLNFSEFGTSGLSSKVMSGTVGTSSFFAPPALIVGPTRRPSVFIAGDSIALGTGDTGDDLTNDFGLIGRSVGPFFG